MRTPCRRPFSCFCPLLVSHPYRLTSGTIRPAGLISASGGRSTCQGQHAAGDRKPLPLRRAEESLESPGLRPKISRRCQAELRRLSPTRGCRNERIYRQGIARLRGSCGEKLFFFFSPPDFQISFVIRENKSALDGQRDPAKQTLTNLPQHRNNGDVVGSVLKVPYYTHIFIFFLFLE